MGAAAFSGEDPGVLSLGPFLTYHSPDSAAGVAGGVCLPDKL